MTLPCFIITVRNFIMTFDEGRIRTCLFPRLSALRMEFNASPNTLIRTMLNPSEVKHRRHRTLQHNHPYSDYLNEWIGYYFTGDKKCNLLFSKQSKTLQKLSLCKGMQTDFPQRLPITYGQNGDLARERTVAWHTIIYYAASFSSFFFPFKRGGIVQNALP